MYCFEETVFPSGSLFTLQCLMASFPVSCVALYSFCLQTVRNCSFNFIFLDIKSYFCHILLIIIKTSAPNTDHQSHALLIITSIASAKPVDPELKTV